MSVNWKSVVAGVVALALMNAPALAQKGKDSVGVGLDTLGIALGDPRDAVQAAMAAAVPGFQIAPDELIQSIGDGRGNEAQLPYYRSDKIGAVDIRGGKLLEVYYTTDLSGGVATSILRRDMYGENEADAVGFIDALKGKFGEPTYTDAGNYGMPQVTFYYVWFDGELAPAMAEQAWREGKYSLDPNPGRCSNLENMGGYTFVQNRQDEYAGCTAYMKVQIMFGRRDDLMRELSMYMIDWETQFADALRADAHLIEQIEAAINGGAGAAAPAL